MKKQSNISSVIFMIIGIVFMVYGVYMIITAINYVTTYTTTATISVTGSMQYVVTSSVSYFGFGLLMIGVSIIIKKLNAIASGCVNIATDTDTKPEAKPVKANVPVEAPKVSPAPVAAEPTKEEPKIISDPLALPSDGLPEIKPEPQVEEIPEEEIEPEFEVEYIYADEETTEDSVIEEETSQTPEQTPMTLEEPPVVEEGTEPEFEVEYIYADEPAEQQTENIEEIPDDVKEEPDKSFKITSDFIKDIFESK